MAHGRVWRVGWRTSWRSGAVHALVAHTHGHANSSHVCRQQAGEGEAYATWQHIYHHSKPTMAAHLGLEKAGEGEGIRAGQVVQDVRSMVEDGQVEVAARKTATKGEGSKLAISSARSSCKQNSKRGGGKRVGH